MAASISDDSKRHRRLNTHSMCWSKEVSGSKTSSADWVTRSAGNTCSSPAPQLGARRVEQSERIQIGQLAGSRCSTLVSCLRQGENHQSYSVKSDLEHQHRHRQISIVKDMSAAPVDSKQIESEIIRKCVSSCEGVWRMATECHTWCGRQHATRIWSMRCRMFECVFLYGGDVWDGDVPETRLPGAECVD